MTNVLIYIYLNASNDQHYFFLHTQTVDQREQNKNKNLRDLGALALSPPPERIQALFQTPASQPASLALGKGQRTYVLQLSPEERDRTRPQRRTRERTPPKVDFEGAARAAPPPTRTPARIPVNPGGSETRHARAWWRKATVICIDIPVSFVFGELARGTPPTGTRFYRCYK